MIIDTHTCLHPYEMRGIRYTQSEFIEALGSCGIDVAVVCAPFYLLSDYVLGNDLVMDFMRNYPDRVVGLATLHPLFEGEVLKEFQRCLDAGMKGVKLHCDLSAIPYDDARTFPILERAGELNVPVLLHTGEDSIAAAQHVASKFTDTNFIFAHIGNKAWKQTARFARERKNVFLCLSGLVFERGFLEEAVRQVGAERVLFGSDFVMVNPMINLSIVEGSELSAHDKENILALNIERLLRL